MDKDILSSAQIRTIINARIAGEVQNQVIGMDVDEATVKEAEREQEREPDWANSLATGPRQGAVGKSGAGFWQGLGRERRQGQVRRQRRQRQGQGHREAGWCLLRLLGGLALLQGMPLTPWD